MGRCIVLMGISNRMIISDYPKNYFMSKTICNISRISNPTPGNIPKEIK